MVVTVHTNEQNPAALKLLVALSYAGEEAEVKIVDVNDKNAPPPRRLPYLFLSEDRDRVFFSTNAVAGYFLPPGDEAAAYRWLEHELVLSPLLAVAVGGSARSPAIKAQLLNGLKTLDHEFKFGEQIKRLSESNPTVYDISIWSTLYPLHKDEGLRKEYLESYPELCRWMEKFGSESKVQAALSKFKIETGQAAYQALLAGGKYSAAMVNTAVTAEHGLPSPTDEVTADELETAKSAWRKRLGDLPKSKGDVHPVLPKPGEKNVLITSALPYVNNVPHLGNIIGCVLSADVFARFSRLCNWNTLYIGGTDEYGTVTETKALEEGLTPQQICDKYFDVHNTIYRWFNIGFDYFGRTTTPEQTKLVQGMFLTLNENGFMQTQPVEQLLCEKCDRYLADRFVEGGCPHPGCGYDDARGDQCDGCGKLVNATELRDPRCKVCRTTPTQRTSKQFFLDLPKLEPLLRHWMEKSVPGWTNNAKVISKTWIREGLKPRCITRDLKWGVPVPLDGYRDKVFYVWFDAPLGYVSMTERYTKEWRKWWQPDAGTDVTLYQFMAKDNVPFHSVMFPACLLGANQRYTLVSHIMATEYLNYEDGKFSKSRGVGVFGTDAQNTTIPSDVWRFYLLYIRPEGQDSSFSWVDLATKNNSELLNNLGNFVNRALVFTEKYFGSTVPPMEPNDDDWNLLALCNRELKSYVSSLSSARLRDGIRCILTISRHGNQYMQSMQPWVLVKGSDDDKRRAGTVIGICCNLTCVLATLLFPYMPCTSRTLMKQLNVPEKTAILTPDNPQIVTLIAPGHKIDKPAPLFAKIEPAYIEEMKKKFGGAQQTQTPVVSAPQDATSLENAVKEQGEKVRALKASGAAKSVWQPEVAVLLELKKKLEAAQKQSPEPVPNGVAVGEDVKSLEAEIAKQGVVVRKLKEGGAPKTEWQPQVDVLLALKAKLAAAAGQTAAPASKSKKETPQSSHGTNVERLNVALQDLTLQDAANAFLAELYSVDRSDLELRTRGQSSSELWRSERRKRLTASNFGRVCLMKRTTSTSSFVTELLHGAFRGNVHTEYGRRYEATAADAFAEAYNKQLLESGLLVDEELPFLAASPDRLVSDESALVEIKCPSTARDLTPVEGVRTGRIKYCELSSDGGRLKLKRTHAYMYQVQGQLHVADKDVCYFVVWTPKGMSVEAIRRDDGFWRRMRGRLVEFYTDALLPEIVDSRHSTGLPVREHYLS